MFAFFLHTSNTLTSVKQLTTLSYFQFFILLNNFTIICSKECIGVTAQQL